jgi:hypothetical protein
MTFNYEQFPLPVLEAESDRIQQTIDSLTTRQTLIAQTILHLALTPLPLPEASAAPPTCDTI